MKEITWYDVFLENLYEKFKKKSILAEEIMDLLCIEREAAYRRLRKEVVFPADEMVKIASAWNISLDEIVGINSGLVPFQLQPINYLDPTKKEMVNLQNKVKALDHFNHTIDTEYMEVSNKLPRPIYITSMALYRFEIFKWAYQYNIDDAYKPYSQIIVPEKICQQFKTYNKNIKQVNTSYFILDSMIFEHIVHNILFFNSILLISDEEKEILKEKLYGILDYLNEIANKGCYPDTQKKVNLYISQICVNTNYSYYYSEKLKSCRIHPFGKFDLCTYDLEMVNNFRTWMHLKKRASIQISEVNEKSRIEFYTMQKRMIDTL